MIYGIYFLLVCSWSKSAVWEHTSAQLACLPRAWEKEKLKKRDRQTDRQRQRERDRERNTDRERQRGREGDRDRERDIERHALT